LVKKDLETGHFAVMVKNASNVIYKHDIKIYSICPISYLPRQ
jgi:sRNA-binding regulator protein Hfq